MAGADIIWLLRLPVGDMRLISVVLGRNDRIRFNESEKLLTWGFPLETVR